MAEYTMHIHDKWRLVRELSRFDLADVVKRRTLVTLDSDTTLAEACHLLRQHMISSAPIVTVAKDANEAMDPERRVFGLFEYRDAVNAIINFYAKDGPEHTRVHEVASHKVSKDEIFRPFSVDNKIAQIPGHTSILKALDALACNRRLVVVPSGAGIVATPLIEVQTLPCIPLIFGHTLTLTLPQALGVVSPMDVAKYLSGQLDLIINSVKLKELNPSVSLLNLGAFKRGEMICASTVDTVAQVILFLAFSVFPSSPFLFWNGRPSAGCW